MAGVGVAVLALYGGDGGGCCGCCGSLGVERVLVWVVGGEGRRGSVL